MNIKDLFEKVVRWIGSPRGFAMTQGPVYLGVVVAIIVRGDNNYMLAFNLVLSVMATTWTGLVLVNQQFKDDLMGKREQALQKKADEVIHALPEADDAVAGSEEGP